MCGFDDNVVVIMFVSSIVIAIVESGTEVVCSLLGVLVKKSCIVVAVNVCAKVSVVASSVDGCAVVASSFSSRGIVAPAKIVSVEFIFSKE